MSSRGENGASRRWRGAALTVAAFLISTPFAHAAVFPHSSAFTNAPILSDAELGELRGRYVSGNQIAYFGVEMVTQWATQAGEYIDVAMRMSVDLPKGDWARFRPTVSVVHQVRTTTVQTSSQQESVAGETGSSDFDFSDGSLNSVGSTVTVPELDLNVPTAVVPDVEVPSGTAVNTSAEAASSATGTGVEAVASQASAAAVVPVASSSETAPSASSVGSDNAAEAKSASAVSAHKVSGPTGNVSGSGVENVTGVVQSIQVAGSSNRVNNDVDVALTVVPESEASSSSSLLEPTASNSSGSVVTSEVTTTSVGSTGTTTLVSGSGTLTTVKVTEDGLGYTVNVPGQGQVVQEIRGGTLHSGGGVLQSTQLISNLNEINNLLRLNLGLSQGTTSRGGAGLGIAVRQLRGIQTPGMF